MNGLFKQHQFSPNEGQREAIESTKGPLYLVAGPGSGKTKVLLWRTVNLIVFYDVPPENIFLSTFTEKAAKQLEKGLQTILGTVTKMTNTPYDISKMYVGTIHSLCQRLIGDRRFSNDRTRTKPPVLLDELDQYFYINSTPFWNKSFELLNTEEAELRFEICNYFSNRKRVGSKHETAMHIISAFNRFSEENISPLDVIKRAEDIDDRTLIKVGKLYQWYKEKLLLSNMVDFSLLQQMALKQLENSDNTSFEFKHVIIDEYQDTNKIQESIFFHIGKGNKNLCVVGDDDQALYRFRGATVENFVQFPSRCQKHVGMLPEEIKLNINYRSKKKIVDNYNHFIEKVDWRNEESNSFYRLHNKNIKPNSKDNDLSVISSTPLKSEDVVVEVAKFVKSLIEEGKVEDPNQIAFLFPSLKNNVHVRRMKKALEREEVNVYAPRAGRFLEVEEARVMFGLLSLVFGKPKRQDYSGVYKDYHDWLDQIEAEAKELIRTDQRLNKFVNEKKEELKKRKEDYVRLLETLNTNEWTLSDIYDPVTHKRILTKTPMISSTTLKGLGSSRLDSVIERRNKEGSPFTLRYILNRATSVDWSILDLFYRLSGFSYFAQMFKLAEKGEDEGPISNLSMVSEYLARYMEQSNSVITGARMIENHLTNDFFGRFVYGLFRLGESEVENDETLFPRGRVQFLTIHQSKGLEFPVVILGNLGRKDRGIAKIEEIVRPMKEGEGEPLNKLNEFDTMRLFYVALSRAEDLLVLTHLKGQGRKIEPAFKELFDEMDYPLIPNVRLKDIPNVKKTDDEIPKVYSYTSDYLQYIKCPRNYMVFRKYAFVPSRSQTMLFGNLVHQTIEDIHNRIISSRSDEK